MVWGSTLFLYYGKFSTINRGTGAISIYNLVFMANNKKEEGVDWVKVAEGAAAVAGAVGTLISVLGGKGNSNKK